MGLLSWLGGRRRETAAAPSPSAGPGSRSTPGWREVPPLQRTLGDLDLVADPDGFRSSLGTWQNASLTGALGHVVSPEAPSGLVHGVAEASPDAAPAPASEGSLVTRRFPAPGTAGSGPASPAVVPVQRAAAIGPLTSASPPPTRLQRQLTAVRNDGVASPPVTETEARSEAAGSGAVQRVVAAEVGEPARPPRVFGLGEPLTALPPTAQREPVARTNAPSPLPEPTPEPQTETRTETEADAEADAEAEAEAEAVQPFGPEPREEAPSRPLLGEDPLTVPEAAAPPEPTVSHAPVPLQRLPAATGERAASPAPDAGPVVPLVAQRSVPLFSAPERPASPPEAGPTVVPVRWEAAAAPPAPGPDPAATPVQRAVVGEVVGAVAPEAVSAPDGRPPSGPRPVPAAPAPVQRAVMPATAYASPPPPPPAPTGGLVDAGAVAVAAGVAQRMPDGSVVFGTPAATARPEPTVAVQRQAETDEAPEPLPEPPPEPAGTESTPGIGDPAAASAATPPAADGAAGEPRAPAVSDEMVRALYAPLSRMLRAELRLERERAGFLINTRQH